MLLAHFWQSSGEKALPFLHFPKVEISAFRLLPSGQSLWPGDPEVAKVEKPETEIPSAEDLGFYGRCRYSYHPCSATPPLPPTLKPKFKLPKFFSSLIPPSEIQSPTHFNCFITSLSSVAGFNRGLLVLAQSCGHSLCHPEASGT